MGPDMAKPFVRCDGCDGYECLTACMYPGVKVFTDNKTTTWITPDPEYDFIEPPIVVKAKRGRQCGICGLKFDYGVSYGYSCSSVNCPMGF